MPAVTISTGRKREVIDVTDDLARYVPEKGEGVLNVFVRHTTAAITTADLDPGTDADFLDFIQAITPNVKWRHPHNPVHAPDHLLASIIGASVTIPYAEGKLLNGTWQRIVLVELDGPRERKLIVSVLK